MKKKWGQWQYFQQTLNTLTIVANTLILIVRTVGTLLIVHGIYGNMSSLSMPHHHSNSFLSFFLYFQYAYWNTGDGGLHADAVTSKGTQPSRVSVVLCRWVVYLCLCRLWWKAKCDLVATRISWFRTLTGCNAPNPTLAPPTRSHRSQHSPEAFCLPRPLSPTRCCATTHWQGLDIQDTGEARRAAGHGCSIFPIAHPVSDFICCLTKCKLC